MVEFKKANLSQYTRIPFELFARWIGSQARIYLERQEILDNEPSTSQFHSNSTMATPSTRYNKASHPSHSPNLDRSTYTRDPQRFRGSYVDRNVTNSSLLKINGIYITFIGEEDSDTFCYLNSNEEARKKSDDPIQLLEKRLYENLDDHWNYLTTLVKLSMEFMEDMFKQIPGCEGYVLNIEDIFGDNFHDYRIFMPIST